VRLSRLEARCIRNLHAVQIEPAPGINQLVGDNGAGKTSLLEAISILSTGRSFRAGSIGSLISHNAGKIIVSAEIEDQHTLKKNRIGISRGKDSTVARMDAEKVYRLSDLAHALPVLIVSAKAHELVEGGPSGRRSFLDWMVFHVEHQFAEFSRRYRTALNQRNSALKSRASASVISSFNQELANCGSQIDSLRSKIFEQFLNAYRGVSEQLKIPFKPEFRYRRGWSDTIELDQASRDSVEQCQRMGATTVGCHRADIRILIDNQEARYIFSRGQQKLLALACRMAQGLVFVNARMQAPVLLFDDITSELDQSTRQSVFSYLDTVDAQVFVTGVEAIELDANNQSAMFHVEQGEFRKVI